MRKKNLKRQKNKFRHIQVWLKAGPNSYVTCALPRIKYFYFLLKIIYAIFFNTF